MAEETLAEQIAKQLRRDILRGKLAPGASIKERDNAAEMGVSRTPMREAIRILSQEGLVVLRPSRSPIVARISQTEVRDRVEVLLALEKLSAELACRHASDTDISEIDGIARYMDAHFDETDPLDMFEIDMEFHVSLVRASHNAALLETHGTLLARLWRARYLAAIQLRNRARVVDQHTTIVQALRNRDPDATRSAVDNHLRRLAEDICGVIASENEAGQDTGTDNGEQE